MSIWKELKKVVNSNFNKTLDVLIAEYAEKQKQQLINEDFYSGQLITASTTWTAPFTGTYKVICVGAGADGYISSSTSYYGGGSGGVSVSKIEFTKGQTVSITISGGNVSFGSYCTASAAEEETGGNGTATNGTVYAGNSTSKNDGEGASVSFYDAKYMSYPAVPQGNPTSDTNYIILGGVGLFGGQRGMVFYTEGTRCYSVSGGGGYGAGGAADGESYGSGGAACVYIELVYSE